MGSRHLRKVHIPVNLGVNVAQTSDFNISLHRPATSELIGCKEISYVFNSVLVN
jgi:hypothetical protein